MSERASWLVPTTTTESAIDSAVSKVALETFEAEAREAIAAFVCGTTFSYCYRLGTENRSTPITAGFRRAVAKEWFDCAFTLLLAGVSLIIDTIHYGLISSLIVVTMRFIAHLFNRNRVKHAT